ncbi:helix-turn-helix transcriptional regulator [Actinokineospora sp. NBRC 105648]|uniref:helix-turn-helix transcriptional regulator n=1 Tax=Actinokineospora sp. NBRC 105648 TaxID=3032206 RepID=UPI00249FDAE8|nr:helix-turn-helix transcriptional regulator [Actinokineospora sp. NBRC 105648]GLZ42701.1 hypothetical protein Acsp05_63250 [Actinokineospora sp. NBRC 105648]
MRKRTRLARARKAAGFTQEALAEAMHVDRSTVFRWELGRSEPLPFLRPKLGRLLGLTREQLETLLVNEPVAPAAAPGRSEVDRRQFLAGTLFSVAASAGSTQDWLLSTIDEVAGAHGKVDSSQIEALRRAFALYQELDVMRGGGHALAQLTGYLEQVVTPLVNDNGPDSTTGRELHSAAGEQFYLLGWMNYDHGNQVGAQTHLLRALELARAAKDVALGAHVLAGLSDQATLTGHPDQGLRLAKTGIAGLGHDRSPACLADLRVLQARAEAALGDAEAADRSISLSQEAFAASEPANEPEWARFIDAAYLHGEYANAYRDLNRPTETTEHAQVSADEAARQNRARRGCMANAALARAALTSHDLEAASAAGLTALRQAVTVTSSRSAQAVTDLRMRMAPHRDSPATRQFLDESAVLMPA